MARPKAKTKKQGDPTALERQMRLIENNEKRGLKQVKVWIPVERDEELKALVAQWRAEHKLGDA